MREPSSHGQRRIGASRTGRTGSTGSRERFKEIGQLRRVREHREVTRVELDRLDAEHIAYLRDGELTTRGGTHPRLAASRCTPRRADELNAGHFAMLTHPAELADLLEPLA